MSGWDRDTSGGYTPPPAPRWLWWLAAALIFWPFVAFLIFG